jgi:hypothetical protein
VSPILGIFASQGRVAANSYESIATVTLGTASATITFSSIPSTYKHLQLRGLARTATTTQDYLLYKPNNANLSARHYLTGIGTSAVAGGSTSSFDFGGIPKSDSTASTFGAYVLDVLDYANTNKNKTLRHLGGFDTNGAGEIGLVSGLYNTTTAISSFVVTTNSGTNFAIGTTFALYGIK